MTTTLFLVRHGQTAWNNDGRFQGQTDIPLDAEGCRQARALRQRLAGVDFSAVYTSALQRAIETARLTLEESASLSHPLSSLNERNFGRWEGLTRAEIMERFPEEWERQRQSSSIAAPAGGESIPALQERVATALRHLASQHPDQTLLVVTHGGVVRTVLGHLLGGGPEMYNRWRIDNTSITVVRVRPLVRAGKGEIVCVNDAEHLAPLAHRAGGGGYQ